MRKFIFVFISISLLLSGCNSDSEIESSVTFRLDEVGDSGISGTAKFIKSNNTTTIVEIRLSGTTAGNIHPAHIHMDSVQEGGDIVITLEPVNGDSGASTTTVTQLDDETTIDYNNLILFDGHVNIHQSAEDLQTILAQGNIGSNTF